MRWLPRQSYSGAVALVIVVLYCAPTARAIKPGPGKASPLKLLDGRMRLPTLDVKGALAFAKSLHAPRRGVMVQEIALKNAKHVHPLVRIDIAARTANAPRILITSGVHGHEALGPTAALELARLLQRSPLRQKYAFTIFPMLNPAGLEKGTSQTAEGSNLQFIGKALQPEAQAFVASIKAEMDRSAGEQDGAKAGKIVAAIDLHGARLKSGFFIIPTADNKSGLAERAIKEIPRRYRQRSPNGIYPFKVRSSRRIAQLKGKPDPNAPYDYTFYGPGVAVSGAHPTIKTLMRNLGIAHSYTAEYPGKIRPRLRHKYMVDLVKAMIRALDR